MDVEDILEFRNLKNTSIENLDVPTRSEHRHLTDKKGFIIFLILFLIHMPFFIFVSLKADIRRFGNTYDDCGNMCGQLNKKNEGVSCSGKDYRNKEWYYRPDKSCVEECPHGTHKKYMPKECGYGVIKREILEQSLGSWWIYVSILSIAIFMSFTLVIALRYFTAATVWSAIIFSILYICGNGGYCFYLSATGSENDLLVNVSYGLLYTLWLMVLILILVKCGKHIPVVIQLFKLTTKAIFTMPCLLGLPFLSLLVQCIILAACIFTNIFWLTAGELKNDSEGTIFQSYNKMVLHIAISLNLIMTFWAMLFWNSFMYMSLAGAVAAWFFAKNRQDLRFPICTSMCIVFKYHLGTLALGSSITIFANILQIIIESWSSDKCFGYCIRYCCQCIMDVLEYIRDRAYIETAIHGEAFCKSGKRVAILLVNHIGPAVTILYVESRILFMMKCLVVFISIGVASLLIRNVQNDDLVYLMIQFIIALVISFLVVQYVLSLIDNIVDVLFICFCEDQEINNGESRPYCMPKNLMQFVDSTKKVYESRAALASRGSTNTT